MFDFIENILFTADTAAEMQELLGDLYQPTCSALIVCVSSITLAGCISLFRTLICGIFGAMGGKE